MCFEKFEDFCVPDLLKAEILIFKNVVKCLIKGIKELKVFDITFVR